MVPVKHLRARPSGQLKRLRWPSVVTGDQCRGRTRRHRVLGEKFNASVPTFLTEQKSLPPAKEKL